MEIDPKFLGLGPHWWEAIGVIATAVITLVLVLVGFFQIKAARQQNQRWRTLEVCDQYHLDLVIGISLKRLRNAHQAGRFTGNEPSYKVDVVRVLNYLDAMAIAIFQGLYIEDLARDHMQSIVKKHVNDYLRNGVPTKVGIDVDDFRALNALEARWAAASPIHRTYFREGK